MRITADSQEWLNKVAKTIEELSEENYTKGFLQGVNFMLNLPFLMEQDLQNEFDRLPEPEEEDPDAG